jgi:hypothetical protein
VIIAERMCSPNPFGTPRMHRSSVDENKLCSLAITTIAVGELLHGAHRFAAVGGSVTYSLEVITPGRLRVALAQNDGECPK